MPSYMVWIIGGAGLLAVVALEIWYSYRRWKPPMDEDEDDGKYGM
jgi:hypothetical protein